MKKQRTKESLSQITERRRSTMWQESRNWMARVGSALVLALVACSVTHAQDVRTNYRPGTDFSKYHTYKWVDEVGGQPQVGYSSPVGVGVGHLDQILDSQIKEAIDSQLAAKGFTKVDSDKADLLLGYQVGLDREKEFNAYGMGGGWGWGPWGGAPDWITGSTSTINIGTLVLSIYDPAAKELVWIGAAQHTIEPSKNNQKNQQRLNKGAQKLLKDFPPGR
jgi:hypothetical protein